jgi:hypothetical protein
MRERELSTKKNIFSKILPNRNKKYPNLSGVIFIFRRLEKVRETHNNHNTHQARLEVPKSVRQSVSLLLCGTFQKVLQKVPEKECPIMTIMRRKRNVNTFSMISKHKPIPIQG